jgi:hypothetical protein
MFVRHDRTNIAQSLRGAWVRPVPGQTNWSGPVGGAARAAARPNRTLLGAAGYQLDKIIPLPGGQHILLARA